MFTPDKKLTDVLGQNKFTLSAEIIPPRNGTEQSELLGVVRSLTQAGAQFLSVTKGAGGSLRGGSLPIAQAIKDQLQVPCIAHFTCRDLVAQEVENQLMDHHYFGIRNILALRGDPPQGEPDWKAREGGHSYAHQLISQIVDLNAGRYLTRTSDQGRASAPPQPTDFCIGAAAYPEKGPADRIDYFVQKIDAGAQFAITDMLFDPESYSRFLDDLGGKLKGVPVIPGTRVLTSRKQATKIAERFGSKVPAWLMGALPESNEEGSTAYLDLFLRLAEEFKRRGAPGVHLFVIASPPSSIAALQSARSRFLSRPSA